MFMSKVNSAIAGAAAGGTAAGPWGALAGGVGGFLLGKDDNSSDIYAQMLAEAQKIPLPVLQKLNPELYQVVSKLNPEMEQNVTLGPSASEGIALDPKYKQAQLSALQKLMDITSNGGEDAQFKADASKLQTDINTNLQGNVGAITQNMAARGMSGGMSEMIAKQIAAQNAANRQSQMGMDLHAQAQQRALNALINQGQMANSMSQNDFNQQMSKANAEDAISKFNAQNLQNVNATNTAAKNNAQELNLRNEQSVANNNVGVKSDTQKYNLSLPQQDYENELRKRGIINQGYQGVAQNSYNEARDQDQFLGGLFSAGAKYAASRGK